MDTWERLKLILFSTIRKALRVLLPKTKEERAKVKNSRRKDSDGNEAA